MVPPGGWTLLFLPHGPAVRLIHSNSLQTFNAILSFKPPCDGCSDQCGEVMFHHVRPTPSRMCLMAYAILAARKLSSVPPNSAVPQRGAPKTSAWACSWVLR